MLDSFFAGRKIKKLIDEFAIAISAEDESQAFSELIAYGKQAVKLTVESFQNRRLTSQKAQKLLDRLCDDSCLDEFILLIGDPFDEVRRVAKEIIVKRYHKEFLPQLIKQLSEPNFYAQTNATEILVILKDSSCVSPLISLFNHATPDIKRNILKILSSIWDSACKRLVISALYDKAYPVRLFAVRCLSQKKDSESVQPLIKKLDEGDAQVNKLVIEALATIGDKQAALTVIKYLQSDDLLLRQTATDCLIALDNPEIVPGIIDLMKSDDVNIRRCGVEVLNNLKDSRTSEILLHAIKDADWWVRQIATDALAEIKGEAVIKGFVAMLEDTDERVRRCAVEFFNVVPTPFAFSSLLKLLDDPDWWVKQKAVIALGKLKDEKAIDPLLAMIHDREVSWVVPSALADIGGQTVEVSLRDLLSFSEKHIRKEAIKAITRMNTASAVSDLMKCLADQDEEVRIEAIASLKLLTGKVYKEVVVSPANASLSDINQYGPKPHSDTLTEAILVLDVCGSTEKVSRYGDKYFLELMQRITQIVIPVAKKEKVQFVKSTGDGFLMTFPGVNQAVLFSRQVLKEIDKNNASADEHDKIDLRFAVNFGETKVDAQCDRLGVAVSMTFRLDGVHPEGLISIDDGMTPEEMPTKNRILLSENAEQELHGNLEIKRLPVGFFELKGIPGLHRIFAVIP